MIIKIAEIFATVLDTLMLVWFISEFSNVSLKGKIWSLIIPFFQLITQLFFDWFTPGFNLLPITLIFLFAFLFAITLSPHTIGWDLVVSITYIAMMMLVSTFMFFVFSLFIENMDIIIQGTTSGVRILHITIGKLLLFSVYKLVLMLVKREREAEVSSTIMTLFLSLGTIVALATLMKLATVIDMEIANTSILIITFVLVVINIILYVFIHKIQNLQKSKYELMLINERIELEKKQSDDATIVWNNIRKVRHDLKNHFSVISAYLERGDTEVCREYINELQQTVESMGSLIRSGSSVIDYLINSKLSNLVGVQILISGCVSQFDDVHDSDMVCILGNILDNAVEALQNVSGTKIIELCFSKVNKNRLIICKNSVSSSVLKNNSGFISTKKDSNKHGLGHQIIESMVKKYSGFVDYFEEDGLFGVEVAIPEQLEE